ncbi:MAG: ribonuclease P protein component [Alphaproteobacteria bacterium]|nr:ribonuclease P protein component [Alphaproteobacteria bacterium]
MKYYSRMKKTASFNTCYKNKWVSAIGVKIFRSTKPSLIPLMGVSVSKKNVKKAVDRNKVKRLLRSLFSKLELDMTSPYNNIVLVGYKELLEANFEETLSSIEKIIKQKKEKDTE